MPNTDLSVTIITKKNMKPSSSYSMLEDADDAALDSPVHHRVGRINVDMTHHDTNNDKDFAIYTVPTKMPSDQQDEIPKKVVDTRYLNDEDLIKLKLQDPFLYYSLPKSVRRRDQFIGYKDVAVDTTESGPTTTPKSFAMVDSTHSSSTKVERRSCISFECYPDLILEKFCGNQGTTSAEVDYHQNVNNRGVGADRDTYLQQ